MIGSDRLTHDIAKRPVVLVDLVPAATSVAILAAFFEPGAKYDLEVVARESSGNQTVTEVPFTTTR